MHLLAKIVLYYSLQYYLPDKILYECLDRNTYICTVLLPPGVNPIAVKYIISYLIGLTYAVKHLVLIFAKFINASYKVMIQIFDFHFSCWDPEETTLKKFFRLTPSPSSGFWHNYGKFWVSWLIRILLVERSQWLKCWSGLAIWTPGAALSPTGVY